MSGDASSLTKAAFADAMGSTFRVRVGADVVELELASLREGAANPAVEQFALTFRGPLTAPLRQGTYPVEHEGIGHFPLFLVPVGRDEGSYQYEAAFNRLVDRSV